MDESFLESRHSPSCSRCAATSSAAAPFGFGLNTVSEKFVYRCRREEKTAHTASYAASPLLTDSSLMGTARTAAGGPRAAAEADEAARVTKRRAPNAFNNTISPRTEEDVNVNDGNTAG